MRIEFPGANELTITGNIKSIEDSMKIKEAISTLQKEGASHLVLRIRDSFSMTSAVIGHLMKVVCQDKIPVTLEVDDPRLYELLDELSLVQTFNAGQIGS